MCVIITHFLRWKNNRFFGYLLFSLFQWVLLKTVLHGTKIAGIFYVQYKKN